MTTSATTDIHAALETLLGLKTPSSTNQRDLGLLNVVRVAVRFIDHKCNRRFIPDPDSARSYDAVRDTHLYVEELLPITAVEATEDTEAIPGTTITAYGDPLDASGYVLLPNKDGTSYDRILRLDDEGKAIRWDRGATTQPYAVVTVEHANHSYAATLPDDIRQAYIISAARLGDNEKIHFASRGGISDFGELEAAGMWDSTVYQLCKPYIRPHVGQIAVPLERAA